MPENNDQPINYTVHGEDAGLGALFKELEGKAEALQQKLNFSTSGVGGGNGIPGAGGAMSGASGVARASSQKASTPFVGSRPQSHSPAVSHPSPTGAPGYTGRKYGTIPSELQGFNSTLVRLKLSPKASASASEKALQSPIAQKEGFNSKLVRLKLFPLCPFCLPKI